MVVAVLLIAGDHVPVIPFNAVVGNGAITEPAQVGATGVKVGMIFGFTTICNVVVKPHWPVLGVKI